MVPEVYTETLLTLRNMKNKKLKLWIAQTSSERKSNHSEVIKK